MSEREYRFDVCPECKVREGDSSEKKLYQCKYCERWFCKKHSAPRLAVIRDFKTVIKDATWANIVEKEWRRKDGHPDFTYTTKRFEELKIEKAIIGAMMETLLDKSEAYGKPIPKKTYSSALSSPKQKRSRKVRVAILAVSLITILTITFAFLSGTIELNIGTPLTPSVDETTTSRVILEQISVFEDQECGKPIQTIDWGHVESNHSYSHTVYARNDYAENDWDDRDIVWQRLNVNPNSVCISIKVNYGGKQIKPNEVRQATITLTVLGLLEDSNKLNPNVDIPQFTFDLILKGQDLSLLTYTYIHTYANRDANNITVVYKDELKETISVIIEIGIWKTKGSEQVMDVVWNSTKYVSEFTETWLGADRYTSYQLIVTINHERYGKSEYRNYLIGQLP